MTDPGQQVSHARLDPHVRRHITDPDADLLGELETCQAVRYALDVHMRLLVAIARHFTRPRPYTLKSLAEATGMSVSGLRTYLTETDIIRAAQALDLPTPPLEGHDHAHDSD